MQHTAHIEKRNHMNYPKIKNASRKNKVILFLAFVLLAVIIVFGIYFVKGDTSTSSQMMVGDSMQDKMVKKEIATVSPVERKNANSLMLVGTVISNESAMIYPRREGIVKDIYVDIGDTVEAGEVIGTLFPRGVEGQADAVIYEAQKKRDLADTIVDAREDLGDAARDAADERDISDEEEELVDEEQDLLEATALENLIIAEANLSKEIIIQGHTKLISPFSGTIAKRYVAVGESITPSKPVFSLVDVPTHLAHKAENEIHFSVSEDLMDELSIGDEVAFFLGKDESKVHTAKVTRISPQIDKMTHQFSVQAAVPDDLNVPHNAKVRVRFVTSDERIYSIPSSSIKRIDDENFVWILDSDDSTTRTTVHVFGDDGEFAEVTGSIDSTSKIIKRVTSEMMESAKDVEMMQMNDEEVITDDADMEMTAEKGKGPITIEGNMQAP